MVEVRECIHCKQRHPFVWHGPNCMPAWIAWAKRQVPPYANQMTATALVGPRGAGKSGGGLVIFTEVQGRPIDIRDQIYFRPSDRIHVARRLPKGAVVYGDESTGEGGHKRQSLSKENVANVMDIDTMRQRNQHSVFTAPEWQSLDKGIQEAIQWVHEFDHSHNVKSYEVQHSGRPDHREHWLKLRFETPSFPHMEKVYPMKWQELLEYKDEFLAGKDDKSGAKERAFEDKATQILLHLLRTDIGK